MNTLKTTDRVALVICAVLATFMTIVFWVSLGLTDDHSKLVANITLLTIVGGFTGGLSMFVYLRPHNFTDGFVRVVVCIMTANMLTQLVGAYITKNQSTGEMWGVAFLIGFTAFPVMSAVARFFDNRKASDIKEMMADINLPGKIDAPAKESRVFDPPQS